MGERLGKVGETTMMEERVRGAFLLESRAGGPSEAHVRWSVQFRDLMEFDASGAIASHPLEERSHFPAEGR